MGAVVPGGVYALDNDEPTGEAVLRCLAGVLDESTRRRLTEVQVPINGRCLELGAGLGTVAGWMTSRVGLHGQVFAVDVKPQHVQPYPGVTVVAADVRVPEDLPAGLFDLIHARLLYAHLPSRELLVADLVRRLAPGGALCVEEWGGIGGARMLVCADPAGPEVFDQYQQALLEVFERQGNDPTWCVRMHAVLQRAGLVEVTTQTSARSWPGGTPGCDLAVAVSTELHDQLVEVGMTPDDLDRLRHVLADHRTVLMGNTTWSTIGLRPA